MCFCDIYLYLSYICLSTHSHLCVCICILFWANTSQRNSWELIPIRWCSLIKVFTGESGSVSTLEKYLLISSLCYSMLDWLNITQTFCPILFLIGNCSCYFSFFNSSCNIILHKIISFLQVTDIIFVRQLICLLLLSI